MNNSYSLSLPLGIMQHSPLGQPLLVRDRSEPANPQLDASVRSGDYFDTLATILEAIALDLPRLSSATNSQALLRLSKDLSYLQRRYLIVKKSQPDELREF